MRLFLRAFITGILPGQPLTLSDDVNLGDESQKPTKPHTPLFREMEPEAWWMEPWLSPPPDA